MAAFLSINKIKQVSFVVPLLLILSACYESKVSLDFSQTVNLSRKNLESIPEEVLKNPNIKILKLYGNSLDSLPDKIGSLTSLEELYVGKNNLKTLPKSIGQLKNLKILSIQFNEIQTLPEEIGQLTNLEQIILNQNRIKAIPESIGNLKKLEMLQLKFNELRNLPESIGNCSNLRFIYLNRNFIEYLPQSIGKLHLLSELYLSLAGPLLQLPESMCQLRLLDVLEVDFSTVIPVCILVQQTTRLKIIRN